MKKELKFIKLAGSWFAHIPDYPGHPDDLQMVLGADTLCESLNTNNSGIVDTIISDCCDDDYDLSLDFIYTTTNNDFESRTTGAYYTINESGSDIWLCNVTKYVFGKFPVSIYIKIK